MGTIVRDPTEDDFGMSWGRSPDGGMACSWARMAAHELAVIRIEDHRGEDTAEENSQ